MERDKDLFNELKSRQAWLKYNENGAENAVKDEGLFSGEEMHIYVGRGVPEFFGDLAAEGIQSIIDDVGLRFRAVVKGRSKKLDAFLDTAIKDEIISEDDAVIMEMDPEWRTSGHMLLVPAYSKSSDDNFRGVAGQNQPGWLFFPKARQDELYLVKRVAKHEMGHILRLYDHIKGDVIPGYRPYNGCVMTPYYIGDDSYHVCDSCLEGLKAFWRGMERVTGKKFFK